MPALALTHFAFATFDFAVARGSVPGSDSLSLAASCCLIAELASCAYLVDLDLTPLLVSEHLRAENGGLSCLLLVLVAVLGLRFGFGGRSGVLALLQKASEPADHGGAM